MSRYTLKDELGRGGMATVFRAEDKEAEIDVAIKILHPHLSSNNVMAEVFYREARLMRTLSSPGVVRVQETIEINDRPAIVMELLEGGTVRQWLARREKLSEEEVLKVIIPVLEVLSEVHDRGIVHRDIKPGNILFDSRKNPKLIDFGIGQAEELVELANAGQIGTVEYMAPERIDGLAIDGRSDLYSLGVMLFELLCGHIPYRADSASAVMKLHRSAPIPEPTYFAPELSPHISQAIKIALAKHPEERFHNAHEMLAMLQGRAETNYLQEIAEHEQWHELVKAAERTEAMAAPVEEEGYEWVVFVPRPEEAFQHDGKRKFAALADYMMDHRSHLQIPPKEAQRQTDDSLNWNLMMQRNGVARGLSRQGVDHVVEALDAANIPSRYARRPRTRRREGPVTKFVGGSQIGTIITVSVMVILAAFFMVARAGYAGSPPVWLDPAFIVFTSILGLSVGWFGAPAMAREFWYCHFSRAFLLDFCLPNEREQKYGGFIGTEHLQLVGAIRSSRIRSSFERALNMSLHLFDFLEKTELPGRRQVVATVDDLTELATELIAVEDKLAHLRPGELISRIRGLERRIEDATDMNVAEAAMEQKLALREQLDARDRAQIRLQDLAQQVLSVATELEALVRRCQNSTEEATVLDFDFDTLRHDLELEIEESVHSFR